MSEDLLDGQTPSASSVIRFGPYNLDLRCAELRKNQLRIRLQDQSFQILVALLERPGEMVSREEIRHKLWPDGTVVDFDHSINAAVKRLRDALSDSAKKPRYVETVARRGYRFTGEVERFPRTPPVSFADPVRVALTAEEIGSPATPVAEPESLSADWPFRRRILIPVVLSAILAAFGAWYHLTAPARWAQHFDLAEANRLASSGKYPAAFRFLFRAQQVIPRDPALNRLLREISHPISIHTIPAGADVYVKAYDDPEAQWLPIGKSPIENFLLPLGYYRWKVEKTGFGAVERGAGYQSSAIEFILDREGTVPLEMVHVPHGDFQLFSLNPVHLDDYWMDRNEVTNRQFKEFLDNGGYKRRQFWREKFIKDSHELSWKDAMDEFRDLTGRSGPSGWEAGDYPTGKAEYPVSGVSWYEAAAYAEFAHKQIPTVYHWFRAAQLGIWSDILAFSNLAIFAQPLEKV